MRNLAAFLFFSLLFQSCHNARLIRPTEDNNSALEKTASNDGDEADAGNSGSNGDSNGDSSGSGEGDPSDDDTTEKESKNETSRQKQVLENLELNLSEGCLEELACDLGVAEGQSLKDSFISLTKNEVNAIEDIQVEHIGDNFVISEIKLKDQKTVGLADHALNDPSVSPREKLELISQMVTGNAFYRCGELDADLLTLAAEDVDFMVMKNGKNLTASFVDLQASQIGKKYSSTGKWTAFDSYISEDDQNCNYISFSNTRSPSRHERSLVASIIKREKNKFSTESFGALLKEVILDGKVCIK